MARKLPKKPKPKPKPRSIEDLERDALEHTLHRLEYRIKRSDKRLIVIHKALLALGKKHGNSAEFQHVVDGIHTVNESMAETTVKLKDAVQPAEG